MPHALALEVLQSIPGYVDELESVFGSREITLDMVTPAYPHTLSSNLAVAQNLTASAARKPRDPVAAQR